MDTTWKYLTEKDQAAITEFCSHHAKYFLARARPESLSHYTTGDNLIRILSSGELWATQITCLNDAKEVLYSIEELHRTLREHQQTTPPKPATAPLFQRMEKELSEPGAGGAPYFVTCFSELADDLSQWRAYCAKQGGYSIQFDPAGLAQLAAPRRGVLVRVSYDTTEHATLFNDILRWSEHFFDSLEGRTRAPSREDWIEEFLRYWFWNLASFTPYVKHPAFAAEKEWRIIFHLWSELVPHMQFRQRDFTMMSRHLSLPMGKLPIKGVTIGPCAYPDLSKIAVGDLLVKHGYDIKAIAIQTTTIPYRVF